MFGLRRNAMIGLNLYCGGASLAAGGGSPAGARLAADEAKARREGGGEAALLPGVRVVARPPPVGAEDPDVSAPAERRLLRAPEDTAAPAAAAIMSPEEELDGYEPETLGKRPAVLPLLERVSEAAKSSGADGSLPSTPPADDDGDELYRQSLEIISRYLREQAAGAKDAKPLGEAGPAGRRALETLRRVGDGVQRNHETAFQGMLRKLDIKNEDDVKSLSRVMVHVFKDGVTNWGRIVTLISFGAYVAKHLKSINQESCIEPLAESITDVLVRTKRDWLVKQRGWDGFVEFFHVQDLEGGIRNVLLAFAGVAGIGAGLAYLIR
ncbi:induced myeloid leukemia cell differentiation protein Mcl-1 isoform X1 [Sigmodon hispidus]